MQRKHFLYAMGAGLGLSLSLAASSSIPALRRDNLVKEVSAQQAVLEDLSEQVARLATRQTTSCPAGTSLSSLQVKEIARAEVASAIAAARVGGGTQLAVDRETPAAPTAENLQALSRGQELMRAGLSAKRWTDKDAVEMHEVFRHLTPENAQTLARQIAAAVNRGDLSLQLSEERVPF